MNELPKTSRMIEISELFKFVETEKIKTILDVGYCGSVYLKDFKAQGKIIDGIDIKSLKQCIKEWACHPEIWKYEKELRNCFMGDIDQIQKRYDLVICLSTLEHAGIFPERNANYLLTRYKMFQKSVELAKRLVYFTFEYGSFAMPSNVYANVTTEELDKFLKIIKPYKYSLTFYYHSKPDAKVWEVISRERADQIDNLKAEHCFCMIKVRV